jgi:hypothetical protein
MGTLVYNVSFKVYGKNFLRQKIFKMAATTGRDNNAVP